MTSEENMDEFKELLTYEGIPVIDDNDFNSSDPTRSGLNAADKVIKEISTLLK